MSGGVGRGASAADVQGGVYHFLDVGGLKYGECTLVEFGQTRILIDGAHVNDFAGQRGYASIPDQLREILGPPPHDITMMVVTHCHADHIGCLPELVTNGVIRPEYALVTDPKLGFGRTADFDARGLDALDLRQVLTAALREEDASDLNDDDLAEFLDAVATVEQRYHNLLDLLERQNVKVIPYRGQRLPADLARRLTPTGLSLLGPNRNQLLRCAEQIATTNKEAEDAASPDALGDLVALYRSLVGSGPAADARNPRGSGMNCQSITFAFGPAGARVLLAGDMQFTEPGVRGVEPEMDALRRRVLAEGPYALFKTTHHTSHNGQDGAWLDALGAPPLIVHSGGLHDADHPYPSVLQILRARQGIRFARTDRNGRITARPHLGAASALEIKRGRLNDFTPNTERDTEAERMPPPAAIASAPTTAVVGSGVQVIIVNLPGTPIDISVGGVEIRIPGGSGGGSGRAPPPGPPAPFPEARSPDGPVNMRSVAGLLFVTDPNRLRANIGQAEADAALAAVEAAGGKLIRGASATLPGASATALRGDPSLKGVVILGGYDVAPSTRTDAIGAELRARMDVPAISGDADEFWVWSDRLYGDKDGDHLAEVPVSRIPDARDAKLFVAALQAASYAPSQRFGVRNVVRPFAEQAWVPALGPQPMKRSEVFKNTNVLANELTASCHYFMLHGMDTDGSSFVGEYLTGGYPLAFTVANVPPAFHGVVFSGCCWGGLVVGSKAMDAASGSPAPRTREASIALSYLRAGAQAFIGCTGSHYSGPDPVLDQNYAGRLHRTFFERLAAGQAPAQALHDARNSYLAWIMSHQGQMQPYEMARRLKNVNQFTCLGLGW